MQQKYNHTTTLRKRKRKMKLMKIMILAMTFIIFALCIAIGCLAKENKELRVSADEHYDILREKNNEIIDLTLKNSELCKIIDEIDDQIEKLESVNKSYVDELNMLRTRAELYDKYEYAIAYGDDRTELTYEEIQYGEELMVAKGLNPHLMFGTIMVESAGKPDAVNNESGATGYGQFLDSTAEWVWTKLLGNSTYNSNIRKDGTKNIQMMAEYYDYLYAEHGNTFKVVKQYSGNSTNVGAAEYLAKVNSFTNKVGEVIN